jgi:hypothetical protein
MGGPFVVARKERLKSSTPVIGQLSTVSSSDDGAITSPPPRMTAERPSLMSLLIVGSYSKRMVDHVRLRKSTSRGGLTVTARATRCEKAAAFAGEHRNPPHLKES